MGSFATGLKFGRELPDQAAFSAPRQRALARFRRMPARGERPSPGHRVAAGPVAGSFRSESPRKGTPATTPIRSAGPRIRSRSPRRWSPRARARQCAGNQVSAPVLWRSWLGYLPGLRARLAAGQSLQILVLRECPVNTTDGLGPSTTDGLGPSDIHCLAPPAGRAKGMGIGAGAGMV